MTIFGKHHQPLSFAFQYVNTVNPLDSVMGTFADGSTGPAMFIGTTALRSPLFAILPGLANLYKAAPFFLVFPLAFLQAQWTYTGYDACSRSGRDRDGPPEQRLGRIPVGSCVGHRRLHRPDGLHPQYPERDIASTALDAYPVLYIAYQGLTTFLANIVAVIVFGGMWLCGLASITSMSRMWFAFGRDGGMPFSNLFYEIHPTLRTRVKSILITAVLAVLTCVYGAAYWVVTSISTITLYIAYNIPVFLNLRNKLRKQGEYTTSTAPWSLKGWGPLINFIAVIYTVFIVILLSLPPNELVLWTMIGLAVLLVVYWFGYAKSHFTGPKKASEEELRRIERELTEAVKAAHGATD